ncbi:MAG TPA: hypothetical protein VGK58_19550 [Lacipirellulaceae bacterium]
MIAVLVAFDIVRVGDVDLGRILRGVETNFIAAVSEVGEVVIVLLRFVGSMLASRCAVWAVETRFALPTAISATAPRTTRPPFALFGLIAFELRLAAALQLIFIARACFKLVVDGAISVDFRVAQKWLLIGRFARGGLIIRARRNLFELSALVGGRTEDLMPQANSRPGLGPLLNYLRFRLFAHLTSWRRYCARCVRCIGRFVFLFAALVSLTKLRRLTATIRRFAALVRRLATVVS